MIDLLVRSVLVSLVSLLLLALVRRASASVRHLIAVVSLGTVLLLPALQGVLPPLTVPILIPATRKVSAAPFPASLLPATEAADTAAPPDRSSAEAPSLWLIVWVSGSGLLLLRWISGLVWLRRSLRWATPIEAMGREVPLLESGVFRTPVTTWTGRTAVVLPSDWRSWSEERLDVVLRHEMAHVRRGDGWSLLLARLALAVFWPNPLVWLLVRAEARLAENAADDFVLSEGVPGWRYARELLAIAQEPRGIGFLPALSMARKAQVSQRVEMILKPNLSRHLISRRGRGIALLVALAAAVPSATLALVPQYSPGELASTTVQSSLSPRLLRLSCKIVRTADAGRKATARSKTEPSFNPSGKFAVISAPTLRMLAGQSAEISSILSGPSMTEGSNVSMHAVPEIVKKGRFRLSVDVAVNMGTTPMSQIHTKALINSNDWVRLRLTDDKGKYLGYQVLMQLAVLNDEH